MKFCKKCFYNEEHPLKITINNEGICSGCLVHDEKNEIDWAQKLSKLKKIIEPYKKSNRSINNCIVPVSGDRDSYFIVYVVKEILGMNPLLVDYNNHYNTKIGIRNLSFLKTLQGCNHLNLTVQPQRVKKITLSTLKNFGSMYWHCIAGQTVFPVQIACKFKIPLIFWGAHQGVDQVGMFSHHDEVEMTRKYRKEHDLMGFEAEDLLKIDNSLKEQDIENYIYPQDQEIEDVGVKGIYLNNYIRWDSKAQHELMITKYNYETEKLVRTFDSYNNVSCFHYTGIHDYIKFLKHGYSVITDHVNREIRFDRISRKDGGKLIEYYSKEKFNDLEIFLKWLSITKDEFFDIIDKFINRKILFKKENEWYLKNEFKDKDIVDGQLSDINGIIQFNSNSKRSKIIEKKNYTLLGRGWLE